MFSGFDPVFNQKTKLLILGSFPSVKSREVQFYYGSKQNRFWKMLESIFKVQLSDIQSKKDFLLQNNIGLWDIVKNCDLLGSMDNKLVKSNYELNDLTNLLWPMTNVKTILCNGKVCYNFVNNLNLINVKVICMPSTSAANVKYNFQTWENEIIKALKK